MIISSASWTLAKPIDRRHVRWRQCDRGLERARHDRDGAVVRPIDTPDLVQLETQGNRGPAGIDDVLVGCLYVSFLTAGVYAAELTAGQARFQWAHT